MIRGDLQNYVIENIRTVSDVAYTPYPMEGQTVATVIKYVLIQFTWYYFSFALNHEVLL